MKVFINSKKSFSKVNELKFYAGKIGPKIVDIQPIIYNFKYYFAHAVNSTKMDGYFSPINKESLYNWENSMGARTLQDVINDLSEAYEFDSAKEKYQWIVDNL